MEKYTDQGIDLRWADLPTLRALDPTPKVVAEIERRQENQRQVIQAGGRFATAREVFASDDR